MPFKLRKQHLTKIAKNLFFIVIIAIFFLVFWFALKYILNTEYPMLPVSSSGMCTSSCCDGFSHPFEPTLHVGDWVIVQGVNVSTVECKYPYSEILVFHNPNDRDKLIITRVVNRLEAYGKIYFLTKDDGEGTHKWPEQPDMQECDIISGELLVGRVVMRIPWVGHIALVMHNFSGIFIILIFIIILLILELVIPKRKDKNALKTARSTP